MNKIEILNWKTKDLSTDGPFDFRLDRGPAGLTETENAGSTGERLPIGVPASPPALLETDAGHIVIHGHRQIDAALSEGAASIPSIVYPADTPRQTVVTLALEQCAIQGAGHPREENKHSGGALSGIEKILAIYKTSLYAGGGLAAAGEPLKLDTPVSPPDWIVPLYANLLGRRVSKPYLARTCTALAFPASELLALARFNFTIDQIASILVLSPKERAAVLALLRATAFTTADLRQLVRLLILARGRAKFDLEPTAAAAAKNQKGGSAITRAIEMEIYPALTARKRRIETSLREMRLPNRLRIKPPENLEGDSFSCYFRFSRLEELAGYVELLGRAVQDGSAGKLLDLLNDGDADTEAQ